MVVVVVVVRLLDWTGNFVTHTIFLLFERLAVSSVSALLFLLVQCE